MATYLLNIKMYCAKRGHVRYHQLAQQDVARSSLYYVLNIQLSAPKKYLKQNLCAGIKSFVRWAVFL